MVTSAAVRTVFVVDDDAAALDSLLMLLRSEGLNPRGYASARDLLAAFDPGARGCLVTDLRMPDIDGVALIKAVRAAGGRLPAIVVTGQADVPRAVEAMKAGAVDFVEKPYASELILRIVRAALAQNDAVVDAAAAHTEVMRRLESLTARERQVLDLIMDGASNKVVAHALTISPRTVEIYRANVMAKMQADSLSGLIRMTLKAGVV